MSRKIFEDLELDGIIENIKKSVDQNKTSKKQKKVEKSSEEAKSSNNNNDVINYYSVLGVTKDETQENIIKKANKKMAEYHQDKIRHKLANLPQEEQKKQFEKYQMQFELIREAREILSNPEKRKMYDMKKKSVDNGCFSDKKLSFDEFIKLQENGKTEDSKNIALLDFQTKSLELDKKHGFNSTQKYNKDEYKFSNKEFRRRIDDMETERNQQDAECLPKKIFNNSVFDTNEFNRQWEMRNRKKKNKEKNPEKSIISWEGISAYNDHGTSGENYVSIQDGDDEFNNLYKTSDGNDYLYSKLSSSDDECSISSISSDDDNRKTYKYSNDYENCKSKDNNLEKKYQKMIGERESFNNTKFSGNNLMDNPFNISSQLDMIVGDSIKEEKKNKKTKTNLVDAYKELMYEYESENRKKK